MHGIHQFQHMVYWCAWQNPVSEIEYVSGPPFCFFKDTLGSLSDLTGRCEEGDRIEVALNPQVVPEFLPLLREVDAPIQSDDIPACFLLQRQQGRVSRPEMNDWR